MSFDEFVDLYVDEYKRNYPGIIGIMIKNWMFNDWLWQFHHDEYLEKLKQIDDYWS